MRHFNIKKKVLASIVILVMLLSNVFIFPVSATSTWSKPRPPDGSDDITYDETIGDADTDSIASIGMGVHIGEYNENDPVLGDYLTFRVSVSGNTRKGIEYNVYEEPSDYHWYEVSTPTGIIYDNQATKILLPFTVQYYGAIYDEVWVYDDGFISFDPNRTSTTPQNIPSTEKPNSIVAPFWRDLNPQAGGSITYGTAEAYEFFIISWNNVPNKDNGVPQTFQIVINNYGAYSYDFQNVIFFQYEDITLDQPTAVGIEDQVGVQSSTFDYTGLYNGLRLKFKYWTEGYRLVKLTIKLTKNDDNHAKVNFIHTDIGGYNVIMENPEDNPYGSLFFSAIGFAAGLLLPAELGIMFGHFLIVPDLALDLSENLSPPSFEVKDAKEYDNEAYVYSIANLERKPRYAPFDATLAANLIWSFTDPNNRDHSLTVAAELTYQDFQVPANCYRISTSVTLNMYVNQPPAIPYTPSGPNSGYQGYIYFYSTNTTDPEGDLLQYQFDWGDGTTTMTVEWYNSGDNATAAYSWADVGTYYVTVRAKDYYGLWSDWSQSLAVSISTPPPPPGGGGGGGCPYVSTWDGGKYVLDNNLLPASELINGTDVEDYYRLEQALVPMKGKYSLLISEFEQEHSYINQVKLLAVDHDSDVNIAVTPDGEILTYKNPAPPISAVDNNGTNRLNELLYMDGNVSDPATHFYGQAGDHLVLNFGRIRSQDAKLILRDDMKSMVICIEVQVLDANGAWQTVTVLSPRDYWSIEAVNLSAYVVHDQDFMVRLFWTSPHRLDYVGLDTSEQEPFEIYQTNMISATHSAQGNVKQELSESDNIYAELVPNQQIELTFTLPQNTEETRTYLFCTKGHYYTIS